MATISIDQIKKLREATGAGIMDCRRALAETKGDVAKATSLLQTWGIEKAAKKSDRTTASGIIHTYVHHGSKVGVMIELACETDFVARTDDFTNLAKELSLQIAGMNPKNVDELSKQVYIRDTSQTIGDMVKSAIGKLGENIILKRFIRYELGE